MLYSVWRSTSCCVSRLLESCFDNLGLRFFVRFLVASNEDRSLLQEGLTLCRYTFNKPLCIYYGTEKGMSNETDIHQMSYGDEQVRKPMIWD